jgi:CRP/FNR family transcriptional regulator, cyclic AMP receptor protein
MAGSVAPHFSPEETLVRMPLFASVATEKLRAFVQQGRLHRFRTGTVIFAQGDPADEVFCILSGRIEVTSVTADGGMQLLAVLAPGDLLGELAILGGMPRSGTAECVDDTAAWAFGGESFRRFLVDQPSVGLALLTSLARLVVAQDHLVEDVLFLDLKGRVAKRLLGLATTSWDHLPPDGTTVNWDLPQTDLAYLCGGTRSNVSRVVSELRRRGVLERSGRRYVLRDVATLRRLAGLRQP